MKYLVYLKKATNLASIFDKPHTAHDNHFIQDLARRNSRMSGIYRIYMALLIYLMINN